MDCQGGGLGNDGGEAGCSKDAPVSLTAVQVSATAMKNVVVVDDCSKQVDAEDCWQKMNVVRMFRVKRFAVRSKRDR